MRSLALCCLIASGCIQNHPFEVCNGIDDDRDPGTPDGLEDIAVGEPCDGPDADHCAEGSVVCVDGQLQCNDATSDNVEECNGEDDDCDGTIDEGFDLASDPGNCGACGHACANANGGVACSAGQCAPECVAGAVDCNGDPDDGCEVLRDRNPACAEAITGGTVSGDTGGTYELTGTDEAIVQVRVSELSSTSTPVTATIELATPSGLDYDLYVYCQACGGAIMGSSRNAAGATERVLFGHEDTPNVNDDQIIYIEIRFVAEATCGGAWHLTVTGATGAPITCGPA